MSRQVTQSWHELCIVLHFAREQGTAQQSAVCWLGTQLSQERARDTTFCRGKCFTGSDAQTEHDTNTQHRPETKCSFICTARVFLYGIHVYIYAYIVPQVCV